MVVTLYSKPGCHLCDEVRALLDELAAGRNLRLEEIDIEGDDGLLERYRFDIPVVLVDGREVARGRIDERQLAATIAAHD